MLRTLARQQLVALVAITGISSVGMRPVIAVGLSSGANEGATKPTWTVQILDPQGKAKSVPLTWAPAAPQSLKLPTPAELATLRQQLTGVTLSVDRKAAARAERALKMLDVVTAKTAADRHAKVLALGVTITERPADDGRNGIIKTFVAGGKARVRAFIPAKRAAEAAADYGDDRIAGPSVASPTTGRWKGDGQGGCYWDPNDSGPDQCSPNPGRWKVGDGCYFDANDSGPDQCEPAQGGDDSGDTGGYTCSDENGPDECATEEQYDDLLSAIAEGEAEYDATMTDIANIDAELQAFCNANPSAPDCPDPSDSEVSGPSAFSSRAPCWMYAASTVVAAASFAGRLASSSGLAVGGAAGLTVSGVTAATLGLYAAAGAAALAVGAYAYCKYTVVPEPQPAVLDRYEVPA